jgi:hypothetical protein
MRALPGISSLTAYRPPDLPASLEVTWLNALTGDKGVAQPLGLPAGPPDTRICRACFTRSWSSTSARSAATNRASAWPQVVVACACRFSVGSPRGVSRRASPPRRRSCRWSPSGRAAACRLPGHERERLLLGGGVAEMLGLLGDRQHQPVVGLGQPHVLVVVALIGLGLEQLGGPVAHPQRAGLGRGAQAAAGGRPSRGQFRRAATGAEQEHRRGHPGGRGRRPPMALP